MPEQRARTIEGALIMARIVDGELIGVDDLCATYGVARPTVYSWNRRGTGPAVTRFRGRCYYDRADVEQLLAERGIWP